MPLLNRVSLLAVAAIMIPASASAASVAPVGKLAQAQGARANPAAPKVMTKATFTKGIDARFAALDTNKDGSLSDAEIAAGQAQAVQRAQAGQEQRVKAEFDKLDSNKDGSLTFAEFRAVTPAVRASGSSEQRLKGIDSNKDGKVSRQEYRAGPLRNFDRLDGDKSGTLSPQEVRGARRR